MPRRTKRPKKVAALTHDDASRKNIPTAEYQSMLEADDRNPIEVAYLRTNRDLDPQLVWRGKDVLDWSDLVVPAPPLFIQEKVHPKALIDDLKAATKQNASAEDAAAPDLFADFNGLPNDVDKTEFYQHEANWANRMILGDSLQVMASLAEREGLRGKVQCIYIDPPYGIKFNSNFQWSTTSRDVKDGKAEHITREPEQVKAFRDTWRDGIHSYLTYLRDRLTVARDLLTESGSVFVQIGDENVHRVRAVMDEVFGTDGAISTIRFRRGGFQTAALLPETHDFIVWYSRDKDTTKFRRLFLRESRDGAFPGQTLYGEYEDGYFEKVERGAIGPDVVKVFRHRAAYSATGSDASRFAVRFHGRDFRPSGRRGWSTNEAGMGRAAKADRLVAFGNTLERKMYFEDSPFRMLTTNWDDTISSGFGDDKTYVVQTQTSVIQRCILMTTDPGDLVLDPTCGSGTTAYVAEQWGRRWITIDTSRVALALARARIMGTRYPYYLLADSPEGQAKEAELVRKVPETKPTYGSIRQGFVYERVPHITLRSIANNAEIDVIHEQYQATLEPLRERLNKALKQAWEEWEIPREATLAWPAEAKQLHAECWEQRIARQREIDASIAAKADYEYLYDKPFEDKQRVRVAGPFTVESLSPHRVLAVDEDDELAAEVADERATYQVAGEREAKDFASTILDNLRTAGIQQAAKSDRIAFIALEPWPGDFVCAEGRYLEGGGSGGNGEKTGEEKRAAIFIGPEFGTVTRPDLVDAAKEAAEAGFDVLIGCAFNYDAQSTDLAKLGRLPVLKARMNADLHMAEDLKNTGKGNLFVIFGEPDIDILTTDADGTASNGQALRVKINGVDVYHPNSGLIRSDDTDGIACWFVDTDYNGESFFVRHAYFLGAQASDPYKSLKTTLRAEIDADAWATLYSDTSRPFEQPKSGRIAVKVINHLGDEVMKVFRVPLQSH